jgi:hypothetical protein
MSIASRRLGLVALIVVTLVVVGSIWMTRADADREALPALEPIASQPLATPVLSARRAPEILRSHIADTRIREAIEPLLVDAPENSCLVVTNGGRPVVARNPERAMVPAST